MANTNRAEIRTAIHQRIRRKVKGSGEKPRLAIYRSLNHIYAQVIDDLRGQTIVSASSIEKDLRGNSGGNLDAARRIGQTASPVALAAAAALVASVACGQRRARARKRHRPPSARSGGYRPALPRTRPAFGTRGTRFSILMRKGAQA